MFPFTIFSIIFFIVFIIMLVFVVSVFLRILRRIDFPHPTGPKDATISKKEIVEETTKIRCPYCGNLYDEKYDRCSHCGAPRKNTTR